MPRLRSTLATICLLASVAACADFPEGDFDVVKNGYQEAVFSVSNTEVWRDFFEIVGGWEVMHEGDAEQALLQAWNLPESASAHVIVMGNPGTDRGFVRLIEFAGVEQQQIRSNAQSWDTGGWFDVNSRILSMTDKFAELQARDWQAGSDPVEFTFGPFVVKEWLARGPDGIVLALIERVQPPLDGWPNLREMSQFFNATQIVPDIDEAREFYMNTLGFEVYLDHHGASQTAGPNVLGLPHNMATQIPRAVTIVHPTGENLGSVELLQFEGLDGADFSARAVPPNLGILMLRFEIEQADDLRRLQYQLADREVEISVPITTTHIAPYGDVNFFAIRGPGGVWIEFFSQSESDAP